MFVDRLPFLYPGSNLTINGRKSQGSGVSLRICFSCAVAWKEERAAMRTRTSESTFRCAPLPVFHVAAPVNLGLAFKFCVPRSNDLLIITLGIFKFAFWYLVSIFSLGVGRMWEGGERRGGKERE